MSCFILFSAKNFDVDLLANRFDFTLENIHKQGDPLYVGSDANYSDSGFGILYTDADFTNFEQQTTDAINFIRTHKADLKVLGDLKQSLPDSEFDCQFCLHTRLYNDFIQEDRFPNELLKFLGEIGAGLIFSQHHPPSFGDDEEDENED